MLKDFLRELPGPLITPALCHNLLCISPQPANREGKRDSGGVVDSGSESGEETVNEIGMRSESGGRMDARDVCEHEQKGRDKRKVEVMMGTEKERYRKETRREKEAAVETEERGDNGPKLDYDGKKSREPDNMKMRNKMMGRGPKTDLLKCLSEPERVSSQLFG